jgi:hypothetical protein
MSDVDRFRWCIYCRADCAAEEPEHAADCPVLTRLWPVTERELQPCRHCGGPTMPMVCEECGHEFEIGEHFVTEQDDVIFRRIFCVGCGAQVSARGG